MLLLVPLSVICMGNLLTRLLFTLLICSIEQIRTNMSIREYGPHTMAIGGSTLSDAGAAYVLKPTQKRV